MFNKSIGLRKLVMIQRQVILYILYSIYNYNLSLLANWTSEFVIEDIKFFSPNQQIMAMPKKRPLFHVKVLKIFAFHVKLI